MNCCHYGYALYISLCTEIEKESENNLDISQRQNDIMMVYSYKAKWYCNQKDLIMPLSVACPEEKTHACNGQIILHRGHEVFLPSYASHLLD